MHTKDAAPARTASRTSYKDMALTGVYEISRILSVPQPLEQTLANVIAVLGSYLQMRRGMIMMLDEAGDPEIAASTGGGQPPQARSKSLVPQRAIDHVVATGAPFLVENIAEHPYFTGSAYLYLVPPRTRVSFLAFPIRADDKVRGVLTIDREWTGGLDVAIEDDVRFLTMIANLVGQSVRMHRLVVRDRDRLIGEAHRLEKTITDVRAAAHRGPGRERGARPVPKFAGIVGDSRAIRAALAIVTTAARTNTTILLRGETGTGKELFARVVHEQSPRAKGPFVKLNCAALPESVIESELFGHEKGSFTGAVSQRAGRFELADGGTIFLDEIGEISPSFQAKLLRVLQEGEFERVGGARTLKVDARIVCATNRNLEEEVSRGAFRADLYYRINVITVMLPPLRDRPGDIPDIAEAVLQRFCGENGRDLSFTSEAIAILSHCAFPGNVRELENCVRRTATLAAGDDIRREDFDCQKGCCLSSTLWKGHAPTLSDAPRAIAAPPPVMVRPPSPPPRSSAAEPPAAGACPETCPRTLPPPSKRDSLISAMEKSGWVQAKAARILGITPRQIGYALRQHDIEVQKF